MRKASEAPARLITIPISHYCEKARWALDRAEIGYVERPHLQMLHIAAAKRAGGGRTVPVFVCADGIFADSTEILEYVDRTANGTQALYPADPELAREVRALEHDFDEDLGPHGRRWMYHNLFGEKGLVRDYGAAGVPGWERRMLPVIWRVATPMIRRHLEIDAETAALSLERVNTTFDATDERLADGRRYLVGERFSAADLTFAALSASVLAPEGYGVPLPPPAEFPEPMRAHLLELRSRPAGQFALRMYAQERR